MRTEGRDVRRGRRARTATVAAVLLALPGCDATRGPAERFQVRDSAGVRVVENRGGAWGPGEAWLVESEAALALGEMEGPEEMRFFRIRDLALRSDGVVVVADGGSSQLRAFGPDGSLLWRQGREGDGPGEYRDPSTVLLLAGDSVAVYDRRARRVTVLDPAGGVARSFVPEIPEGASLAAPVARVAPQRWVVNGGVTFSAGEGSTEATERPDIIYHWMDAEGEALGVLDTLPSRARLVQRDEGSVGVWTVPFSRPGQVAAGGGRVVTADPDRGEWRVRDDTGTLEMVLRLEVERPPVTPRDWERALELALSPAGEEVESDVRRMTEEAWAAMERPERHPVSEGLFVDGEGAIWVEQFRPPWVGDEPVRWWIFLPDGRFGGEVSTPADLEVRVVTRDAVLGTATDEMGIERVRLHRIRNRTP